MIPRLPEDSVTDQRLAREAYDAVIAFLDSEITRHENEAAGLRAEREDMIQRRERHT